MTVATLQSHKQPVRKRRLNKVHASLDHLLRINIRHLQPSINKWMAYVRQQMVQAINKKFAKASKRSMIVDLLDWNDINRESVEIIKPAVAGVQAAGGNEAYRLVGRKGHFDPLTEEAAKEANFICANAVKQVNQETKNAIRIHTAAGIRQGKSMPAIAKDIKPLIGLTPKQWQAVTNYRTRLEEKYPNATKAALAKKEKRYADTLHRKRAETIARTEAARAQTAGYARGLMDDEIEQVEFSCFPNCCTNICEPVDGEVIPTKLAWVGTGKVSVPMHPNCRCAFLPMIEGKPVTEPIKPEDRVERLEPTPTEDLPDDIIDWQDQMGFDAQEAFEDFTGGGYEEMRDLQSDLLNGTRKVADLTDDEVTSLNKVMRLEKAIDDFPQEEWGNIIEEVMLSAPESWERGSIWRGMNLSEYSNESKKLLKMLDSKKSFSFDSVNSFSLNKTVAREFAEGGPGEIKVMLRMKKPPKRSCYAANLSRAPEEMEVLTGADSKYRVVKTTRRKVGTEKWIQYDIEEVHSGSTQFFKAPPKVKKLKPHQIPKGMHNDYQTRIEEQLKILIKKDAKAGRRLGEVVVPNKKDWKALRGPRTKGEGDAFAMVMDMGRGKHGMYFNPKFFGPKSRYDMDKIIKKSMKGNWSAVKDLEGMVTHEFGHVVAKGSTKGMDKLFSWQMDQMYFGGGDYKKNIKRIVKDLGKYSTTNFNELFAEAYTQAVQPGKTSATAKKVLKMVGVKI